ncbi:hypothetical protein [Nonomuraea dietziae]|uniref:hypothetical protein n=1 Tax=Nonomuraea dietziae TaxID=65515 RepID=UPI0033F58F6E
MRGRVPLVIEHPADEPVPSLPDTVTARSLPSLEAAPPPLLLGADAHTALGRRRSLGSVLRVGDQ